MKNPPSITSQRKRRPHVPRPQSKRTWLNFGGLPRQPPTPVKRTRPRPPNQLPGHLFRIFDEESDFTSEEEIESEDEDEDPCPGAPTKLPGGTNFTQDGIPPFDPFQEL